MWNTQKESEIEFIETGRRVLKQDTRFSLFTYSQIIFKNRKFYDHLGETQMKLMPQFASKLLEVFLLPINGWSEM
ncbi:CLUMA_CG013611, isoform A [Clunio marinus]|uniref:CLUMA_CG013611, isoform A n=1 Tax=Clunio marinus TaxID=568069 RepID=A0A1J1IKP8_9DIPT|nr:CLUMA_CG013611, isoform A [Clunio marinus]